MTRPGFQVLPVSALAAVLSASAHASGGGEVLYLMFGAFALIPFAVLGPILALVAYASAPDDDPSSAKARAIIGALVAYAISYTLVYLWLVVGT